MKKILEHFKIITNRIMRKAGRKHRYCINCHFLTKYRRNISFSLNKKDREELVNNNFCVKNYSLKCNRNVWDEKVSGFVKSNKEKRILKKRKIDDCFFEEYHEDMLFPAVIELSQRKYNARQLNRALNRSTAGLWIAALSILFSTIISVIGLFTCSL